MMKLIAIRTDVIPSSIYRHHSTPGGTLQDQGHQSDILLRRYFSPGEHKDARVPAQRLCIGPVAHSGVQTQPEKVPADAITGLSIPRTGMEFNEYASFTSTDETRSNTTTDRSFNENAYGLHERLYGSARQDEFRSHSDPNRPFTLPATTILPTSTCERPKKKEFFCQKKR